MQNDEGSEVGGGKCQYGTIDTIDYNGECIEEVLTINCQCGEPESVEVSFPSFHHNLVNK